ncbi:MAG: hypothetical protein ACE5GW_00655 [Planctomycetota bacterium]
MRRFMLISLSWIPGASAILMGRGIAGSLLMVVGLAAWDAAIVGFKVWQGPEAPWIAWSGLAAGVLASGGSVIWTLLESSPGRRRRRRQLADRALETALRAYLRGKLREARVAVEAGRRGDGRDVDLLFLEWQLARQLGDEARARRLRSRLRRTDLDEKWQWELERAREMEHA